MGQGKRECHRGIMFARTVRKGSTRIAQSSSVVRWTIIKEPYYFLFITQKTKQIWKWYIIYQNIIAHVYIQAFVAATLGQFPLNLENPINFAFHSNLNEFVSQKNPLIQRVFNASQDLLIQYTDTFYTIEIVFIEVIKFIYLIVYI